MKSVLLMLRSRVRWATTLPELSMAAATAMALKPTFFFGKKTGPD